jgi:hypothetical protein
MPGRLDHSRPHRREHVSEPLGRSVGQQRPLDVRRDRGLPPERALDLGADALRRGPADLLELAADLGLRAAGRGP